MKTIEVPIIETERDLDEALARVEALIEGGDDARTDEIRILSMVIQAYEDEQFPIGDSRSVRIIKFFMEQNGYTNKDLARVLGAHSRVSEIMSGKRSLSVRMIRALHAAWKIPLNCLIEPMESVAGVA
jgi:HTH-type transcriptional regulator / antitoxin HigA